MNRDQVSPKFVDMGSEVVSQISHRLESSTYSLNVTLPMFHQGLTDNVASPLHRQGLIAKLDSCSEEASGS
jgi:hypothetical protein